MEEPKNSPLALSNIYYGHSDIKDFDLWSWSVGEDKRCPIVFFDLLVNIKRCPIVFWSFGEDKKVSHCLRKDKVFSPVSLCWRFINRVSPLWPDTHCVSSEEDKHWGPKDQGCLVGKHAGIFTQPSTSVCVCKLYLRSDKESRYCHHSRIQLLWLKRSDAVEV